VTRLSLEYEFIVMYKPGRIHVITHMLSKLPNIIKSIGVPNKTINATLFHLQPVWLEEVNDYL
jgi:hypothetical protein